MPDQSPTMGCSSSVAHPVSSGHRHQHDKVNGTATNTRDHIVPGGHPTAKTTLTQHKTGRSGDRSPSSKLNSKLNKQVSHAYVTNRRTPSPNLEQNAAISKLYEEDEMDIRKANQKAALSKLYDEEADQTSLESRRKTDAKDAENQTIQEPVVKEIERFPNVSNITALCEVQNVSMLHMDSARTEAKNVFGREDILKEIEDYILSTTARVPLCIEGDTGMGKTALSCKAVLHIKKLLKEKKIEKTLLCHMADVQPSTSLLSMLNRLLVELKYINPQDLIQREQEAVTLCRCALSSCVSETVILIDGLEKFQNVPESQVVAWLPRKLSTNVKVILTLTPASIVHRRVSQHYGSDLNRLSLGPFTNLQALIKKKLQWFMVSLSEEQVESVSRHPGACCPLWCHAVLDYVCQVKFQKSDAKDIAIGDIPADLTSLFGWLIANPRTNVAPVKLEVALAMLVIAPAPVSFQEVKNLIGSKENLTPDQGDPKPWNLCKVKCDDDEPNRDTEPPTETDLSDAVSVFYTGQLGHGLVVQAHSPLSTAVCDRYLEESDDGPRHRWWNQKLLRGCGECARHKAEVGVECACRLGDHRTARSLLLDPGVLHFFTERHRYQQLQLYWNQLGSPDDAASGYLGQLKLLAGKDSEVEEEAGYVQFAEDLMLFLLYTQRPYQACNVVDQLLRDEQKHHKGRHPHQMAAYSCFKGQCCVMMLREQTGKKDPETVRDGMKLFLEAIRLREELMKKDPQQIVALFSTKEKKFKSFHVAGKLSELYHHYAMDCLAFAHLALQLEAAGGALDEDTMATACCLLDDAKILFNKLSDTAHALEAQTLEALLDEDVEDCIECLLRVRDQCRKSFGEVHPLVVDVLLKLSESQRAVDERSAVWSSTVQSCQALALQVYRTDDLDTLMYLSKFNPTLSIRDIKNKRNVNERAFLLKATGFI